MQNKRLLLSIFHPCKIPFSRVVVNCGLLNILKNFFNLCFWRVWGVKGDPSIFRSVKEELARFVDIALSEEEEFIFDVDDWVEHIWGSRVGQNWSNSCFNIYLHNDWKSFVSCCKNQTMSIFEELCWLKDLMIPINSWKFFLWFSYLLNKSNILLKIFKIYFSQFKTSWMSNKLILGPKVNQVLVVICKLWKACAVILSTHYLKFRSFFWQIINFCFSIVAIVKT